MYMRAQLHVLDHVLVLWYFTTSVHVPRETPNGDSTGKVQHVPWSLEELNNNSTGRRLWVWDGSRAPRRSILTCRTN